MIDASLRYARAVAQWHLGDQAWADEAGGCEYLDEASQAEHGYGQLLHLMANGSPLDAERIARAEIPAEDFDQIMAQVDKADPELAKTAVNAEPSVEAIAQYVLFVCEGQPWLQPGGFYQKLITAALHADRFSLERVAEAFPDVGQMVHRYKNQSRDVVVAIAERYEG